MFALIGWGLRAVFGQPLLLPFRCSMLSAVCQLDSVRANTILVGALISDPSFPGRFAICLNVRADLVSAVAYK